MKVNRLEAGVITPIAGDSVAHMKLISLENELYDQSKQGKGEICLLFIFAVPCVECNTNLIPWSRLTDYFDSRVKAFGILRENESLATEISTKSSFKLFAPVDKTAFVEKMHLKTGLAHTLVIYDNKIKAVKLGKLDADGIRELTYTVNYLLKQKVRENG